MSKVKEFAKIYKAVKQSEKEQHAALERKRRQEYINQQQAAQINENTPNTANNQVNAGTNVLQKDWQEAQKKNLKLKDDKVKKIINPITITLAFHIIIIVVTFISISALFIVINSFLWEDNGSGGSSIGTSIGYSTKCTSMTVIKTDNSTQTYDEKDYIAGVVAAEIGGFKNLEVYKVFAIAARTYGETHSTSCSIKGDATKQAFRDITGSQEEYAKMIYQAVEETEGIVLMQNGTIYGSAEYDAFCYIEKQGSNYMLAQKNQSIPISWVESHGVAAIYKNCPCNANDLSKTECWDSEGTWLDGGHGRGMSQYGALYLATEKDYDYKQILGYYYDDVELSTKEAPHITTVTGLSIKDTTNAQELHESLASFLPSRGSSVDDLKKSIKNNVERVGVGTREGVVTAAVSLVNFLYDNAHVRLPYYWGGEYQQVGINPSFGGRTTPKTSTYGTTFYYAGFDCSGFASWAIRNGGYKFSRLTTVGFDDRFAKDSCVITDANCKGQPGDLINSRDTHVQLIVSVDEENGKYYVVESTGSAGLIMHQWGMHSPNTNKGVTRILHMDNFYNNKANVDQNY